MIIAPVSAGICALTISNVDLAPQHGEILRTGSYEHLCRRVIIRIQPHLPAQISPMRPQGQCLTPILKQNNVDVPKTKDQVRSLGIQQRQICNGLRLSKNNRENTQRHKSKPDRKEHRTGPSV